MIEDLFYGRAVNRIRGYYVEHAGTEARYFMLSTHDDAVGVLSNMGLTPSRWQLYLTAASAVAVVNSVVGGAALAIACWVAFGNGALGDRRHRLCVRRRIGGASPALATAPRRPRRSRRCAVAESDPLVLRAGPSAGSARRARLGVPYEPFLTTRALGLWPGRRVGERFCRPSGRRSCWRPGAGRQETHR